MNVTRFPADTPPAWDGGHPKRRTPMMSGGEALRRKGARDLAQLLALARRHLATTRPRVCLDCGHVFILPSLSDGRVCWRCAIHPSTKVCFDCTEDEPGVLVRCDDDRTRCAHHANLAGWCWWCGGPTPLFDGGVDSGCCARCRRRSEASHE